MGAGQMREKTVTMELGTWHNQNPALSNWQRYIPSLPDVLLLRDYTTQTLQRRHVTPSDLKGRGLIRC